MRNIHADLMNTIEFITQINKNFVHFTVSFCR